MKIIFLTETYFPKVSGVPIVVQYLAEGCLKQGHDVYVATRKYEGFNDYELINEVKVYRFSIKRNWFKMLRGEISNYQRFLLDGNFDVIIAECSECATFDAFIRIMKQVKGKKILHSHGISLGTKPFFRWEGFNKTTFGYMYNWLYHKWYYNRYLPKYIHQFDGTICLSKITSAMEYSKKYSKKTYILPNAVDNMFLTETGDINESRLKSLDKPFLFSCANYMPVKNQIGILKQFFRSDLTDYALVFIGREENDYYKKLVKIYCKLCKKHGHRTVLFLTNIPRVEIPNIMDHAVLYLVGSVKEEFSVSIIEAMSKGVPFISTNVGNAKELPGGITIDKLSDMSTAISQLIDSPEIRKELGNKGKCYVYNNCRKEKVVEKFIDIIQM